MTEPAVRLDLDYGEPAPRVDLNALADRARSSGRSLRRRRRVAQAGALAGMIAVAGFAGANLAGLQGSRGPATTGSTTGTVPGAPSPATGGPDRSGPATGDQLTALLQPQYARVSWPPGHPMTLERLRTLVPASAAGGVRTAADARTAVASWAQCAWVTEALADLDSGGPVAQDLTGLAAVETQLGLTDDASTRHRLTRSIGTATSNELPTALRKFVEANHCSEGFPR